MTDKKLLPFNLERALAGDPVVTRHGLKVKEIYCMQSNIDRPVIIVFEDRVNPASFNKNGTVYFEDEDNFDLFMVAKTKTYWINIYRTENSIIAGPGYNSEIEARIYINNSYIQTISIEVDE